MLSCKEPCPDYAGAPDHPEYAAHRIVGKAIGRLARADHVAAAHVDPNSVVKAA